MLLWFVELFALLSMKKHPPICALRGWGVAFWLWQVGVFGCGRVLGRIGRGGGWVAPRVAERCGDGAGGVRGIVEQDAY